MKIRHKTWYWGNFIENGTQLGSTTITVDSDGFEPYIESKHGFHHSDEYKRLLQPKNNDLKSILDHVFNTSVFGEKPKVTDS